MYLQAKKNLSALIILATYLATALGQTALAEPVQVEHGRLARALNLPVYQWQDNQRPAKAVVLAIHGLTMHGTVFDAYARRLAADGIIVIATDLRGYGAWYQGGDNSGINYLQSEKDLCALTSAVRQQYKGLPLFLAGESLGGSMAIRLAARNEGLVDGLILVSPAIKLHYSIKTIVDALVSVAKPSHQFDVSNYIRKNFSEDPQITAEGMTDPLIRKHLSMVDLYRSCQFIAGSRQYISQVPSNIPVLILQGAADRIVKPSGAALLNANLRTADKCMQLLPTRGHILIETQHIHQDTMNSIVSWVDSKCTTRSAESDRIAIQKGSVRESIAKQEESADTASGASAKGSRS